MMRYYVSDNRILGSLLLIHYLINVSLGDNIMKLFSKCLLLTSLFTIGLVPTISTIPAQAASTTKECDVKKLNEKDLYFLVGKDELVKAKGVEIITNNSHDVDEMDEITSSSDYMVKVLVPKTATYNLKGTKLSHTLSQGTVCSLGGQKKFAEKTYYKVGAEHFVPMTEVY